jgi:hypothetical protein
MQVLNYFLTLMVVLIELNTVVSGEFSLYRTCPYIGKGYISRDILRNVLEKEFCPDAVKLPQSSNITSWIYNAETPEEVEITIDWKNKPNFELNLQDCLLFLRDMLDVCSVGHSHFSSLIDEYEELSKDKTSVTENPATWSPGGRLEVNDVIYQITPLAPRGGCTVNHYDHYHHVEIWGAGWGYSDMGKKLEGELKNSDLLSDTFQFSYERANDRGWTATMYTKTWENGSVANAAKRAGAGDEFECNEG